MSEFRPEFLELWAVKETIEITQGKKVTTWIFTATATLDIIKFVVKLMKYKKDNTEFFMWKLLGDNIKIKIKFFEDYHDRDKMLDKYIKNIIKENKWKKKENRKIWIVFCMTTKQVEELYKKYNWKYKWKIWKYHWKMKVKTKESNFNKFISWDIDIIFSTNAFWRWIDKANIWYIIHYWVSSNIVSYVQEIGRWWRWWQEYEAITL